MDFSIFKPYQIFDFVINFNSNVTKFVDKYKLSDYEKLNLYNDKELYQKYVNDSLTNNLRFNTPARVNQSLAKQIWSP